MKTNELGKKRNEENNEDENLDTSSNNYEGPATDYDDPWFWFVRNS